MKKLNKKLIIYILIIITILFGIYYFFIKEEDYIENDINLNITNEKNNETENNTNKEYNEIQAKIVVYITGAIRNEGIYELKENSRIADIIETAGGLREDANIDKINLASILEDGMKIYIPTKSESNNEILDNTEQYITKANENGEEQKDNQSAGNTTKNQKININTATQAELETLPGIGPSTALKIIEYRKENGKFSNIEDIKKVNGIGDSKYNKIKDLIKV